MVASAQVFVSVLGFHECFRHPEPALVIVRSYVIEDVLFHRRILIEELPGWKTRSPPDDVK